MPHGPLYRNLSCLLLYTPGSVCGLEVLLSNSLAVTATCLSGRGLLAALWPLKNTRPRKTEVRVQRLPKDAGSKGFKAGENGGAGAF
mmetsp:Transcript_25295/g.85040  ORF Transcript_25295/g.85040 Transcript_25295/m.85040 type:complete len:87 (-) Transcript_25295:350-610(-)